MSVLPFEGEKVTEGQMRGIRKPDSVVVFGYGRSVTSVVAGL